MSVSPCQFVRLVCAVPAKGLSENYAVMVSSEALGSMTAASLDFR